MIKLMKSRSADNWLVKSKNWPMIFWGVFIIAAIISIWGLLSPLPRITHDGTTYETWLLAFDSLIRAREFFPSWIKDFWFEHGSPLFVFYPPLFFYLAEIPRLLGASLVISVKIVVGLSFLFSFFTMYLLAKEFWGKWGGLIGGLLYMTAPYHFALIYTRGAYAENLAYALFPLVLWFIYKVFKNGSRIHIVGLAASLAALILTNLPSLLAFSIFALLFIIGLAWHDKKLPIVDLGLGGIGALGLSAFYWLPAFLNRGSVPFEHFITGQYNFAKYFIGFLDYLPFQPWTELKFYQLGIAAWVIILVAVIYLWRVRQQSTNQANAENRIAKMLLAGLVLVIVLTTSVSYAIWVVSQFMPYIQFPYRFLSAIFILISLLGAYLAYRFARQWAAMLLILILIQSLFFAHPIYEFPSEVYRSDVAYTVYGDVKAQIIELEAEGGALGGKRVMLHTAEEGYLPRGIDKNVLEREFQTSVQPVLEQLSLEETATYTIADTDKIITPGEISDFQDDETTLSFTHRYDKVSRVYYRQFGFPGWRVLVDKQPTAWAATTGQMDFIVPAGTHLVEIEYMGAPGAGIGRIISLLFLAAGLAILLTAAALRELKHDLPVRHKI